MKTFVPWRQAWAVVVLVLGFSAPSPAQQTMQQSIVREGVAIELEIVPTDSNQAASLVEGQSSMVRFNITDTATGQPLSGLYPAAWMSLIRPGEEMTPENCVEKVEDYLSGSILTQAEMDLNVYYVLALNNDATVTVVDPLFGFGGTKLLAMLNLKSPGEDWAINREQSRVFISQPEAGAVAIANTLDWEILRHVPVGERPTRMVLQDDGARLWVTLEGGKEGEGAGIVALDPKTGDILATIPTGVGPHDLVVSQDNRFVFASHRAAGTVSVIDVRTLTKIQEIPTGKEPASIDYSDLAGAAYVSHSGDGTVVAIDGSRHEIVARLETEPGVEQLRISLNGRLAFAVNPTTDQIWAVDLAANQVLQSGVMKEGPEQVTFTETLAYVRHARSEHVLMIPLPKVEAGFPVSAADFPGGQRPYGEGQRGSAAPSIVRAPGAVAVLVANPADKMIYYYQEGMAAPMGGFQNYKREPRAVLVVDRSLGERREPGLYETAAKMRRPGQYEVAFFLDTPRIAHCFPVVVEPDPERERQRLAALPARVRALEPPSTMDAGEPVLFRFQINDPRTGAPIDGLDDVQLMAFSPNNWNQRWIATGQGNGVYEAAIELPAAGSYTVAVACPSRNVSFNEGPELSVNVR